MILIKRYTNQDKEKWNEFNKNSKNSLFMFDRNFMDYHKDRFLDHSLMFYSDDELIAILPMSQKDDVLTSHGGLTYGGIISDNKMKQHTMNDCFEELVRYAKMHNIKAIRYKAIPHIYHNQPAEEDRFSLYANGAQLMVVDASTYINLSSPLKMQKLRCRQIARAKKEGVIVSVPDDLASYKEFINLLNSVLEERHDTKAVHTAEELKMLHDRFPKNIHLFVAQKEGKIIAGVVVFEYEQVVHTQYLAANDEARKVGALDLSVVTVIEKYRSSKKWLDFGISTEHDRIYLNEGLIAQKEGFGGRTGVYEMWELRIS